MKKIHFCSQDKTCFAVLLFFAILLIDLLASLTGFGGAFFWMFTFEMIMFSTYEGLIISIFVICSVLLTALYSYKMRHIKKLKALGIVNLILSVAPFVLNSVYYPFSYLVSETFAELTGNESLLHFSDIKYFLSEFISIPMCILCFALIFRLKRERKEKDGKKIPFYIISLITVASFAIVTMVCYYICNTPVSEWFNYSVFEHLTK